MGHGRVFFALAILIGLDQATGPRPALAGPIATDPYMIGTGGYAAGKSLYSQGSVPATGFVAGSSYSMGSQTNNFITYAGGLAATDASSAGHVSFSGVSDNLIRASARQLAPVASANTYWFSINVGQDGTSTALPTSPGATTTLPGYALAGFGNTTPPTLGATTNNGLASGSSSYLQGLFFGFAHEASDPAGSNGDLVIRYRNTTGYTAGDSILLTGVGSTTTYSIIAKLDVNVNNGSADQLTYWLNPTNTSSQAALDSSSLVNNDGSPVTTYAFQTTADFFRLTYSAQAWIGDAGSASFGDPTMGLSLADVVPAAVPAAVPEPASALLMGLGLIGGLGVAARRRPPGAR